MGKKMTKNYKKWPYFANKLPKLPTILTSDVFLLISKFLEKFAKNWPIFFKKKAFFYRFFKKFTYPNFAVNLYLVSGKWSDWSKNWYTCSLGY